MSYLATIITNLAISIHGKKGSKPKEIKDFLLNWDTSKPKEEGTDLADKIKNIFIGMAASNKGEESRRLNKKRIPKSLQK